jgi:hypothetical protein
LQLEVVDLVTTDKDGDGDADGSWLGGQFAVDLTDPNHDDKLTLAELSGASFGQLVSAGFTGRADVDLDLFVSFGGNVNFPSFKTQLAWDWDLFHADTSDAPEEFGGLLNPPRPRFVNVRINPGEVIQPFAGPVLETINNVLDPLRPVIDVLLQPVPVISDLQGSPVTLLDVAEFFGYLSPKTRQFIEAAARVIDLVGQARVTSGGEIVLPGFTVDDVDLRRGSLTEESVPEDDAPIEHEAAVGNFLRAAWSVSSEDGQGLRFPILEKPSRIFELLLGRDVQLVTLDLPALDFDARYQQAFPIFPPFLTVVLAGRIGAQADLAFGFDTSGLRQAFESGDLADVFNGFYVSDTGNPAGSGPDIPELTLTGSFTASAVAGGKLNFGFTNISIYAGATKTPNCPPAAGSTD